MAYIVRIIKTNGQVVNIWKCETEREAHDICVDLLKIGDVDVVGVEFVEVEN